MMQRCINTIYVWISPPTPTTGPHSYTFPRELYQKFSGFTLVASLWPPLGSASVQRMKPLIPGFYHFLCLIWKLLFRLIYIKYIILRDSFYSCGKFVGLSLCNTYCKKQLLTNSRTGDTFEPNLSCICIYGLTTIQYWQMFQMCPSRITMSHPE